MRFRKTPERGWTCQMLLACIVACLGMASPAQARDAQGYSCTFGNGTIRTFENGAFNIKSAKPLSFVIGEIDLQGQNAALVTPKGKGNLRIVQAIGAIHFLEVVAEGFLNITTVYAAAAPDGNVPAVHSRHFGLMGIPVVSQYHGFCKPEKSG